MKRYLVFCYGDYYPNGGWNDLVGKFDSLEEAIARAKESESENREVVDLVTDEVTLVPHGKLVTVDEWVVELFVRAESVDVAAESVRVRDGSKENLDIVAGWLRMNYQLRTSVRFAFNDEWFVKVTSVKVEEYVR